MQMSKFPTSFDQASSAVGEFRAGGTDLQDRRRNGKATGPIVDLNRIDHEGFGAIMVTPTGLSIGARTTVAALARSEEVQDGWPALALTARGLATPQIREMATVGGNLVQHTRCPYARHEVLRCAKSGGVGCPARAGDHHFGVVIDQGPCVAPHPSSLGVALLVYDATVQINETTAIPVGSLWGDGSDPERNHSLRPGELITAILLPPAVARERGGYVRAISRFEAEWPLAEAAVRVVTTCDGVVTAIRVAVGGVANTPLRLQEVEQALIGKELCEQSIVHAAEIGVQRCQPLSQTAYKVPLLRSIITDALEQASQTWMH
jgi:xanthine dehydrogenase YagS FAD-binding subunit